VRNIIHLGPSLSPEHLLKNCFSAVKSRVLQLPLLSFDEPPTFAMLRSGGRSYWPEAVFSGTATRWTRSGLVFQVPRTIQEPVLVVFTHQGGNRYEYAGIRLY
jgi:hypothetical protein